MYIIKPFVLTTKNLKLNVSSIQTNNQIIPVITENNRIYYEYNDAIKFNILKTTFTKNDLRNTYYDRTTKKIHLGEPIKHYNTELLFINNKFSSGFYSPNLYT